MAITAAVLLKLVESFDWDAWSSTLEPDLYQAYRDLVIRSGKSAADGESGVFNGNDPFLQKFMTEYVGERIKQLEGTTKENVIGLIRSHLADADPEDGRLGDQILASVREQFEGYEQWRADRIARTEGAIAKNHGRVMGLAQSGVTEVEVVDGTDDDACAEANGQTWTLREALEEPISHPNCTRILLAISSDDEFPDEEESRRRYETFALSGIDAGQCAVSAERIARRDDPHAAKRVIEPDDEGE